MWLLPGIRIDFLAASARADFGVNAYASSYDPGLVAVSVLISVFASFCALEMTALRRRRLLWVNLGAAMLGVGIWAMHFIGMLAFRLQCSVGYDAWTTAASMLPGLGAAAVALHFITAERISPRRLVLAGAIMGTGVGLMHYSGMAAIRLDGILRYDSRLFVLSMVAAVVLAIAALSVRFLMPHPKIGRFPYVPSLVGGTVMGVAISGMHYVAMEAAYFIPSSSRTTVAATSPTVLAGAVGLTTLLLICFGFVFVFFNTRMSNVRHRTRIILAKTHQGLLVADERGVITQTNPALLAMAGLPETAIIGRPVSEFLRCAGDDLATHLALPHFDLDCSLSGESGDRTACQAIGGTVLEADGRSSFTYVLLTDISKRLATEQALRDAKLLAEDAARVKADFLANMSHEIRTPMNAVIGLAHLLLNTSLDDKQRDYLKKIRSSSQHLLGVINDILDFSKIESGKLSLEHIEFDLDHVLENVAGLIVEKSAAKGLEFIIDVAPEVPRRLVGDPLRIGQVLLNYASNAVKFTDRGEISIAVTMGPTVDDDLLLHFAVRDTGAGIDDAQARRLFQSFEQGDSSTTRKHGGTGLGLAISKRLAEMMGGSVGLESRPGQGSTFWFTARVGRSKSIPAYFLPKPDLRGRRVLVVDDNQHAREVLVAMLRSMSFDVESAESGSAALAELDRASRLGRPFEIVFIDWQMPEMDGIDLARAIAARHYPTPPRRVMVSAFGRDELARAVEAERLDDLLVKPVSPSLLFDSSMRLLGGDVVDASDTATGVPGGIAGLSGARVLLVEDNQLNQEVAAELLRAAGFEVDIANNGVAAVARVQEADYDIVLMDMQMPEMDGLEATRRIRALGAERYGPAALPILAMTASAMASDRERCLAAGMNDHLAKPIDPVNLMATLQRWIRPAAGTGPRPSGVAARTDEGLREAPIGAFDGIPGLDARTGLRLAGGSESLYRRVLRKYAANHRGFVGEMRAALALQDTASATRLAHTLKGVSAQIGAQPVSGLAGRLERAVAEAAAADAIDVLLAQIDEILARLLPAIEAAVPLPPVSDAGGESQASPGEPPSGP